MVWRGGGLSGCSRATRRRYRWGGLARGLPAERVNPMSEGVVGRVLTTNEQQLVTGTDDPSTKALLHFSAKEAVYKAIFPTVRRFVGFLEVENSGARC